MTTRADRRRSLRKGLDSLVAELGARDSEPLPDFARLTDRERAAHDELIAKARSFGGEDLDAVEGLAGLTYDDLCVLRAVIRKAKTGAAADARDAAILETVNASTPREANENGKAEPSR